MTELQVRLMSFHLNQKFILMILHQLLNYKVDLAIVGDVNEVLKAVIKKINNKQNGLKLLITKIYQSGGSKFRNGEQDSLEFINSENYKTTTCCKNYMN